MTLLDLLQVLVQVDERVILVILTGDVGAKTTEAVQLLLDFFGGGLDVGSHAFQVLLVVHVRPGITDDLDPLGQEFVAILQGG